MVTNEPRQIKAVVVVGRSVHFGDIAVVREAASRAAAARADAHLRRACSSSSCGSNPTIMKGRTRRICLSRAKLSSHSQSGCSCNII